MTKRMLIDATHAEETRVVVLDGNRLEDFDVETSTKRQLKGNIYLAKVVRVEPSLQAAFVEYGGNRHGFLAFSEIHPDYYQIPVADRQRLLEMQAEEARREEEAEDLELALNQALDSHAAGQQAAEQQATEQQATGPSPAPEGPVAEAWASPALPLLTAPAVEPVPVQAIDATPAAEAEATATPGFLAEPAAGSSAEPAAAPVAPSISPEAGEAWANPALPCLTAAPRAMALEVHAETRSGAPGDEDDVETFDHDHDHIEVLPPPETIGGGEHDTHDEPRERRLPPRFLRNYKIQEVIRRRQILLVQVVKEERGTKGAALTTYLSLAGRFGVLMPNSPRGGGISRKITSAADRRRLKEVMAELDIPQGMGLIVRTAGANRPKPEIKRDCEYLLRLWDDIREHTLKSVAPALIYEEASLIKRAIRDVYSRDIDEILVDGEDGWRAAHDFMRMLMPAHAKKVQLWRDGGQPLFARHGVESQLDAMLSPTVQLRSGGYLVINQAEALVAIDVNSGRSTRERNIEETALRTNLEAADEVARQLRLRDLAGLIVIDFIDMESKRHNAMVERRIKEALKNDRARIQVGHISHFGLLEMSRQRLRPSLAETSFIPCPHCGGTGHVRSTESAAIHVLRGVEDEGGKRRSAEIIVHVSTPVALYLLNHKRERLREIETRYAMHVIIAADDTQIAPHFRIERLRTRSLEEAPPVVTPDRMLAPVIEDEIEEEDEAEGADEDEADQEEEGEEAAGEAVGDDAERRRKRRRRRKRGRREDQPQAPAEAAPDSAEAGAGAEEEAGQQEPAAETEAEAEAPVAEAAEAEEGPARGEDDPRNRRRGRRGGRRRRRDEGEISPYAEPGAEQPDLPPVYAGPTPADPFGGRVFDIFDVMEQAEQAAGMTARASVTERVEAQIVTTGPAEPAAGESLDETGATATTAQAAAAPETPPPPAAGSESLDETGATQPGATQPQPPEGAASPAPAAETVDETGASRETLTEAPASPAPDQPALTGEVLDESGAALPANASVGTPGEAHTEAPTAAIVNTAAPEPGADLAGEVAQAEPPPPEPAVKPIVIGTGGEPPAEKKRGWWRR